MDPDELLDLIATETAGLIAAVEAAGPDASVPGCPDWTAADLVWHIAEVQDFWGYVVRERSLAPAAYEDPDRPDGLDAVVTFARDRAGELVDVLGAADPATRVWSWTGEQDAGWVVRRMAHEAALHRLDAEQAAGREHRIDAVVAADGIDEFLTWFAPHADASAAPVHGTVHLHCTDTEGEWTVALGDDDTYSVTREHAKGDAAIRGPAHDLLRVLWRRAPLGTAEVFGDADLAAAFVARTGTG